MAMADGACPGAEPGARGGRDPGRHDSAVVVEICEGSESRSGGGASSIG